MSARAETATASEADLKQLSRHLCALGDPMRQRILLALSRERLNVGELSERFPLSRPAMSHQLKVLTHAGLLIQERVGRERVYRVDRAAFRDMAKTLRLFITDCCSGSECC